MLPVNWVIPLGKGSAYKDIELMYMLRGLETHHPEAIPTVIGEKPVWYKGKHVPFPEDITGVKENNIRLKVLEAASRFDEFVFSNDDHFLLKPFTGSNYYQHDLSFFNDMLMGGIYKLCIMNTIKICGPKFPYYDVHTPIVINSEIFKQHCSSAWGKTTSCVLKTFYAFHAKLLGVPYVDAGIKNPHDMAEIRDLLKGRIMFTINSDQAMTSAMIKYLNICFPNKSKWE